MRNQKKGFLDTFMIALKESLLVDFLFDIVCLGWLISWEVQSTDSSNQILNCYVIDFYQKIVNMFEWGWNNICTSADHIVIALCFFWWH